MKDDQLSKMNLVQTYEWRRQVAAERCVTVDAEETPMPGTIKAGTIDKGGSPLTRGPPARK